VGHAGDHQGKTDCYREGVEGSAKSPAVWMAEEGCRREGHLINYDCNPPNGHSPGPEVRGLTLQYCGEEGGEGAGVFRQQRDGLAHNLYIDGKGYRVPPKTPEHGQYAPPQWAPFVPRNNCQSCGDWRHKRFHEDRTRPCCRTCLGLHLSRECPYTSTRPEERQKSKEQVEALKKRGRQETRQYKSVEEEMDTMYPVRERRMGGGRIHNEHKGPSGTAPRFNIPDDV